MRFGFVSVLVGVAAACMLAGSGDVSAQGASFNPRSDCVRPLTETAGLSNATTGSVASTCHTVAIGERGIRSARANFYSGRAYRAQYVANNNDRQALQNAISYLRIAVNSATDFGADFGPELRASRYELVEALVAKKSSGALVEADEMLNNYPPEAVAFERAEIARARDDKAGAFTALAFLFTRSDNELLENPACLARNRPAGCSGGIQLNVDEARRGRQSLIELGVDLGGDQLRQNHPERAARYLLAAKDVVRNACPSPLPARNSCPTIADGGKQKAYFLYGVAELLAAGVPQDGDAPLDQAGALNCLRSDPGARDQRDSQRITDAATSFREMSLLWPRDASAKWGQGCAILANFNTTSDPTGDLALAIGLLRDGQPNTTATYLSLGRAMTMQGVAQSSAPCDQTSTRNDVAIGCFQKAIQLAPVGPNQDLQRSNIYVEMARARYYRRQTNDNGAPVAAVVGAPPLFTRVVTEVDVALGNSTTSPLLASAVDDLDNARRSEGHFVNVEAALLRGHILLTQQDFTKAGKDFRDALRNRAPNDSTGTAEGSYLLSRCMTQAEQSGANGAARCLGGRTDAATNAISLAVRAATIAPISVYRHQACVAAIVYSGRDDQYCNAGNNRDSEHFAEASLFEGLFWLKRARATGSSNDYSRALQAFQAGLDDAHSLENAMNNGLIFREVQNQPPLTELLDYGRRYVLYSNNLKDPKVASDEVKHFYARFGFRV